MPVRDEDEVWLEQLVVQLSRRNNLEDTPVVPIGEQRIEQQAQPIYLGERHRVSERMPTHSLSTVLWSRA